MTRLTWKAIGGSVSLRLCGSCADSFREKLGRKLTDEHDESGRCERCGMTDTNMPVSTGTTSRIRYRDRQDVEDSVRVCGPCAPKLRRKIRARGWSLVSAEPESGDCEGCGSSELAKAQPPVHLHSFTITVGGSVFCDGCGAPEIPDADRVLDALVRKFSDDPLTRAAYELGLDNPVAD